MDTQEIMDEYRYGDQRFQLKITDYLVVFFADFIQGLRGLIRSKGCKQDFRMPVGIACADIVLNFKGKFNELMNFPLFLWRN